MTEREKFAAARDADAAAGMIDVKLCCDARFQGGADEYMVAYAAFDKAAGDSAVVDVFAEPAPKWSVAEIKATR